MGQRVRESAKALVALGAPMLSSFVTEVIASLGARATALIAAGATALCVWLVPNATKAPAE